MKSILLTSLIPIAFRFKITPLRLHLIISGIVTSYKSVNVSSENSLKHLPALFLPALPALYVAEFLDIASTFRASIPVEFL